MKILLTIEDISIVGGVSSVVRNLANALSELYEVEVLSFYQKNEKLFYEFDPKLRLSFYHTHSQSLKQEKDKRSFFKRLFYKNIYKFIISYKLKKKASKDKIDFIIASDWVFFPFFKNKSTSYIKIMHGAFVRYNSRNKFFDTLVILSSKELKLWQAHCNNVKVIANFLPQIPSQDTNYAKYTR